MQMVHIRVGKLELAVEPGAAAAQAVPVSSRWRAALERSSSSAAPSPDQEADRLIEALTQASDTTSILRREVLYERAANAPLDEALLVVMAWGLGTTGQWNFLSTNTRRSLQGRYEDLQRTRAAIEEGTGLDGLWKVHFSGAPPGLGSVSFGSKWLHAVGYRRVSGGAQPLVYDQNVHRGLTLGAQLDGFAEAKGVPRQSWLRWCELAHEAAEDAGPGVSAADVELAVFEYGKTVGSARP